MRSEFVLVQEVTTGKSPLGRRYTKFRIVLKKGKIALLGWKKGQPIEERIVPEGLLLKPIT